MGTASTPATISGRVVNAVSGLPVPRALVRFQDRAMLTGRDGKFEFSQVTDAKGNLQVIKPGYYSSVSSGGSGTTSWRADQNANLVELRLYPEAIFTGTVIAPNGDPLPHVMVSARRRVFDGSSPGWTPAAQAQTDSHGRFRLPVPPGDYRLESTYIPQASGSSQAILPVVLPVNNSSNTSDSIRIRSGEEQHFDLHPMISRSYTVSATFDSDVGRGFPRITARSNNGANLSLSVKFAGSGASNSAQIELPSGTFTLTASIMSSDGIEQAETTVTITDHDVSGVVFHIVPVPTLPVELLLDTAATSDNSQVSLQQLGLTLENSQSDSDAFNSTVRLHTRRDRTVVFTVPMGSYRLRSRSDGAWYIKSASYGASDLLQQDLVIGPGTSGTPIRITVSDQAASLQGVCRLGGAPADCWVYLIPTTPNAQTVFILHGNNAQGVYYYSHLPPGTYQAIAFEERYSANYADPAALLPFTTHVRTVTVNAGEKPVLDLDVVPVTEMVP